MVKAREGRKSRNLLMIGEGGHGAELSWYDGTEMGDARVGG